jgi:hypothetical protein
MFQVYYYNFGQKFTDNFTRDEAIKEITDATPYKKRDILNWSDNSIGKLLQELFTP